VPGTCAGDYARGRADEQADEAGNGGATAPGHEQVDAQAVLDAVARAIAALRKDAARAFPGRLPPDRRTGPDGEGAIGG
jgi:hypothetical protein